MTVRSLKVTCSRLAISVQRRNSSRPPPAARGEGGVAWSHLAKIKTKIRRSSLQIAGCRIARRKLRRFSDAVATSREGRDVRAASHSVRAKLGIQTTLDCITRLHHSGHQGRYLGMARVEQGEVRSIANSQSSLAVASSTAPNSASYAAMKLGDQGKPGGRTRGNPPRRMSLGGLHRARSHLGGRWHGALGRAGQSFAESRPAPNSG